MIDTVFFDIGGVLLTISPETTIQQLAQYTGLTIEDIQNAFPKDAHDKYEKGFIPDEGFYQAYLKNLPSHNGLTSLQFWDAWSQLIVGETEVIDVLKSVAKSSKTWLLSNTNPMHIETEIHAYQFPHQVDGAVYSFDVGLRKPDPAIYHKACAMAKTLPERCIFIDDLKENIDAAISVGMNGIHFKNVDQLKNELEPFGVLKIQ
ncbi:MAG: HAD family phosphatase [Candidatus Marinimicrobia bacterium]|nr:HAD family phosphatase [Candidatus Neomarinimicrobiota bacterium]